MRQLHLIARSGEYGELPQRVAQLSCDILRRDCVPELRKLVPWIGHDEHFHVRLFCPPGNPQCQPQARYSDDDGCGEALELWFRAPPVVAPTVPDPRPYRPKLPAACQQILSAP